MEEKYRWVESKHIKVQRLTTKTENTVRTSETCGTVNRFYTIQLEYKRVWEKNEWIQQKKNFKVARKEKDTSLQRSNKKRPLTVHQVKKKKSPEDNNLFKALKNRN